MFDCPFPFQSSLNIFLWCQFQNLLWPPRSYWHKYWQTLPIWEQSFCKDHTKLRESRPRREDLQRSPICSGNQPVNKKLSTKYLVNFILLIYLTTWLIQKYDIISRGLKIWQKQSVKIWHGKIRVLWWVRIAKYNQMTFYIQLCKWVNRIKYQKIRVIRPASMNRLYSIRNVN